MNPFQAMIAAQHLDDLRRDAAASRRAREARLANAELGQSGSGDPRRALARLAIGLSRAAGATARRLDPALDEPFRPRDAFARPRTSGVAGR